MDEGVRFDEVQPGPYACVDCTSHVYWMYEHAARWSRAVGSNPDLYLQRAEELGSFIRNRLFDPATGFFYDTWTVDEPRLRRVSFEGMWPIVVGAAAEEQAVRVIDEYLLNPCRFFAYHPITSVAMDDPGFELRCWRGPSWNSMTYWAAIGCMRYVERMQPKFCSTKPWMLPPSSVRLQEKFGSSIIHSAAVRRLSNGRSKSAISRVPITSHIIRSSRWSCSGIRRAGCGKEYEKCRSLL